MSPIVEEEATKEKQAEDVANAEDVLSGDRLSTRRPNLKRIFIKLLYNPLIWLAIGAHVLLLVVPFDPSAKQAEIVEEPEEEIDESIPVDILNLSALSGPEPPEPPPPADNAPEPVPADVPPPPAAPIPSESPVAVEPTEPVEPTQPPDPPDPDPPDPDPPAYDATADRNQFVANLEGFQGLSSYRGEANELPAALNFRTPRDKQGNGHYFLDFSDPLRSAPLPNAIDAIWYKDTNIAEVVNTMRGSYEPAGYQLVEAGEYGQEELYELTEPGGNTFMFVSAVNFPGSVLLVMWPENPNNL